MNRKFNKNDRALFHAYVMVDIVSAAILILGIVYGIITIINGAYLSAWIIVWGVIMIVLISPIIAFVYWIVNKLLINMCCDIKLIRNKLYGIDNDYLHGLTGDDRLGGNIFNDREKRMRSETSDSLDNVHDSISSGNAETGEIK